MSGLRQQELRLLLDFLRDIYTFQDHEAFVAKLRATLPQIIRSDLTSYDEMNPIKGTSKDWVEPPGVLTPDLASIWNMVMQEHPVLMHNLRTGDGRAYKISDFLSQRQFHSLALYNELYRLMEVEDVMCIGLSVTSPPVIGIAVHRNKRDFSEQERLLLDLLRPHLIQAYHNAKAVTRLQNELAQVGWALEKADPGMILLDVTDRILQANACAQRWMVEYFGGPLRQGNYLPEALERWVRQQKVLYGEREQVPPPREPLVEEREDKRLIVRMVADGDRQLLLLEEEYTAPRPESLDPLGLTRRETEVLAWVVRGKTAAEIALILGMSRRTVEKHVERIYEKLGVETRLAATRRTLEFISAVNVKRISKRF